MNYAGFWIRVLATLIDAVVIIVPLILFELFLFSMLYGQSDVSFFEYLTISEFYEKFDNLNFILSLVISLFYYIILTVKYGGTVGKLILGLRVVNVEEEKISYIQSLGRFLAYYLSGILCIGYIMVGITKRKQGLHDILVRTYVMKIK